MKNLFKEAHNLTKEIKAEYPEVDYKAQFAICLSYLQEMKGENKMKVEEKLTNLGYKVWKKNETKRVYINNLMELAEKLNVELSNPKMLKKESMYFDCNSEKFFYNVSSSKKETVEILIETIRNN